MFRRENAKLRFGFAVAALVVWSAYALKIQIRLEFVELGSGLMGWTVLAVPVALYFLLLRRLIPTIVAGFVLIATRLWIMTVLETSTSSTEGLVVIPALIIDIFAILFAFIAEGFIFSMNRRSGE